MKITEKNRSFVFLFGTMIAGLLFIGVLMLIETTGSGSKKFRDDLPPASLKELERQIENLKYHKFNPGSYSTIVANISSNYDNERITVSAKNNLMTKLRDVYSDLVYDRCESFLNCSGQDKSDDLFNWLTQLETITSRNSQIDDFRNQIRSHEYYTKNLPAKVQAFLDAGVTEFDENTYLNYKKELEEMPNLAVKYKTACKLSSIRNKFIPLLEAAYVAWFGE